MRPLAARSGAHVGAGRIVFLLALAIFIQALDRGNFSTAAPLGFISIFSIAQTLAGPNAAGKWMGLQNGFGGLAGVLSPIITGASIDATGDYRVAFLIAAGSSILGMFCWGVVIRKVEPMGWSRAV